MAEISFEDIAAALVKATPEQLLVLKQIVAPETKLADMEQCCQGLLSDIAAGAARARDVVQRAMNDVNTGNHNALLPTFDEIVTAFSGR